MKRIVKVSKTLVAAFLLSMALVGSGWATPSKPAVDLEEATMLYTSRGGGAEQTFRPLFDMAIEINYSGRVISMDKREKVVKCYNALSEPKSDQEVQTTVVRLQKYTNYFRSQIAKEAEQDLASYRFWDAKINNYKSDFLKEFVSFFVLKLYLSPYSIAQSILDLYLLDDLMEKTSTQSSPEDKYKTPSYDSLPAAIQKKLDILIIGLVKRGKELPSALSAQIEVVEGATQYQVLQKKVSSSVPQK